MKKFLVITVLAALTYSCGSTKKAATAKATPSTPAVAETPTPNPPTPMPAPTDVKPAPATDGNSGRWNTKMVDAGKEVYNAKCGRCHALKNANNWKADEWTGIMDKMAPKARLTEEEKKNTLAYVYANSKQ